MRRYRQFCHFSSSQKVVCKRPWTDQQKEQIQEEADSGAGRCKLELRRHTSGSPPGIQFCQQHQDCRSRHHYLSLVVNVQGEISADFSWIVQVHLIFNETQRISMSFRSRLVVSKAPNQLVTVLFICYICDLWSSQYPSNREKRRGVDCWLVKVDKSENIQGVPEKTLL